MIVLDTDHISLLQRESGPRFERLMGRLEQLPSDGPPTISVISVEEQMRGWMAVIAREKKSRRQVPAYLELADLFRFYSNYTIIEFDEAAADRFDELRAAKIKIGTMDLKIAAICLTNRAKLVSANLADFTQVPGLAVENWAD